MRAKLFSFLAMMVLGVPSPLRATSEPQKTVWLETSTRQESDSSSVANFELGNGRRWRLFAGRSSCHSLNEAERLFFPANFQLAFLEGLEPKASPSEFLILKTSGDRSLIAGKPSFLERLQRSPMVQVFPVDLLTIASQNCEARDQTASVIKSESKPQGEALRVDQELLMTVLRELSGDLAVDGNLIQERGSEKGRQMARAYLKNRFAALGLNTEEQCFGSRSQQGCNVVATMPGKSPEVMVVSAHLDSMNNAGADDDGTGVAALVAIASALRSHPLRSTVHFVGFDLEEKGLLGSKAYVAEQLKRGVAMVGDVNLEMLGYDGDNDGVFHIIDCKRRESQPLVDLVNNLAQNGHTQLKPSPYCTNRSDHASFWNAGIPALVLSQNFFGGDSNPCYHARCDKMDKIRPSYFGNLADLAADLVATLVAEN